MHIAAALKKNLSPFLALSVLSISGVCIQLNRIASKHSICTCGDDVPEKCRVDKDHKHHVPKQGFNREYRYFQ